MRVGVPLSDADRAPWLATLHGIIASAIDRRESLVVACSALRQRYRDALRGNLRSVRFVYLEAAAATLRRRLADRSPHFAGPELLDSQLAALEPPSDALSIDAAVPTPQIVARIRYEFGV